MTKTKRATTERKQVYDESSIKRYHGLAAVRKRPGMYMGERGEQMVYRMVKEIVDNCNDEYFAGRNDYIELVADTKTNVYIVADRAGGVPVGMVPVDPKKPKGEQVSTLTLIFTELHTGGKFDDKAYEVSAGTHGVGAAAVNALSTNFEVWTFRQGHWYHQKFSKGEAKSKLLKDSPPPSDVVRALSSKPKLGTIVRFTPDQEIVSADGGKTRAVLNVKDCRSWLRNVSNMSKGLTISITADGENKVFTNKVGIIKILNQAIRLGELEVIGKPLLYESKFLAFAVQWSSYSEDDGVKSYVNSSFTRDGGTHVDEFFSGVVKALAKYKGPRDKYTPKDVQHGLVGALNWKMSEPEFNSQVKDRLTSNLKRALADQVEKYFNEVFAKNRSLARKIIARANDVKKSKDDFKKVMRGLAAVSSSKRGVILPNILATARNCKPVDRELYLVEGESAAGCFVGSTLVRLADRPPMRFDEMAAKAVDGETFRGYSYDLKTGNRVEIEFDSPRLTKHVDELIEVELSDGTTFQCTTDHPWLLQAGQYCAAEDLKVGDALRSGGE